MANIIPPAHTTGTWDLKTPFTTVSDELYTLIAIRGFEDITKLGKDVYNDFYVPMGIKEGENIPGTSTAFSFEKEKADQVVILTIMSPTGKLIYVPSSFVNSFPDTTTIPYKLMILSVPLGYFRDGIDYSILRQSVEETIENILGVDNVDSTIHAGPSTKGLTQANSDILEQARISNLNGKETNVAKVIRLEQQVASLQGDLAAALKILQDNNLIN